MTEAPQSPQARAELSGGAAAHNCGAYRGPDRRAGRPPRAPTPVRLIAEAAGWVTVALLAARLLRTPLPATASPAGSITGSVPRLLLSATAVLLAVAAAELCWVTWQLVGDAAIARVGVGVLLYGTVVVPSTLVLPAWAPGWHRPAVDVAGALVLLGTLGRTLIAPQVDGGLDFLRDYGIGVATLLGLGTVAVLASSVTTVRLDSVALTVGAVVVAGGATTLAAATVVLGWRRDRGLLTRTGIGFALVGLATLVQTVTTRTPDVGGSASGTDAVVVVGLAAIVLATLPELQLALRMRGWRTEVLRDRWTAAEDRARGLAAASEERAHELRSALISIEGATVTLERHRDQLSDAEASALSQALGQEIRRLQQLVTPDASPREPTAYDVSAVLEALVRTERAAGRSVELDVAPGLRVRGHPGTLAEVVVDLMVNAGVHAPGATVRVQARPADGPTKRVHVIVTDDGPGLPPGAGSAVFARGWRAPEAASRPGSGLGLYVSAELLRAEGGRLAALANAPGARFLLDLPAAAGPDLELPAHRRPGADLVGADGGRANVVEGRR